MKHSLQGSESSAGRRTFDNFVPPRCPGTDCPSHGRRFSYRRNGSFSRKCDRRRVPRFRCTTCGRGFSVQTFRVDYRLKRPDLLPVLFDLFNSKVTLRQAARLVGSKLDTVARHQQLLGIHFRRFHQAIRLQSARSGRLLRSARLAFDELETFETDRVLQPVTVPVVVDADTFFIFDAEVAALAPRENSRKARAIRSRASPWIRSGGTRGRRCGSRRAVRAVLRRSSGWTALDATVVAHSDKKATYGPALARAFGNRLYEHSQTPSTAPRTPSNPLFPANLSLAMLRDGVSRLVRRSWAHSKHRGRLRLHLWIWMAWRNWLRPMTNRSGVVTPAMAAGFVDEPLSRSRLLGWHGRFESLAGRA